MKIGDKLEAKIGDGFDGVTKGEIYEVVEVFKGYKGKQNFKIKNDYGKVSMPIGAWFRKVEAK